MTNKQFQTLSFIRKIRWFVVLSILFDVIFISFSLAGLVLFFLWPESVSHWHVRSHFVPRVADIKNIFYSLGFLSSLLFIIIKLLKVRSERKQPNSHLGKEFMAAGIIFFVLLISINKQLFPFSVIHPIRGKIITFWDRSIGFRPELVLQIDSLPVKGFLKRLGLKPERAIKVLRKNGIKVSSKNDSIGGVLKANNATFEDVFLVLQSSFMSSKARRYETLPTYCQRSKKDCIEVIKRLKNNKIIFDRDMPIEYIAKINKLSKWEIYSMIDINVGPRKKGL